MPSSFVLLQPKEQMLETGCSKRLVVPTATVLERARLPVMRWNLEFPTDLEIPTIVS